MRWIHPTVEEEFRSRIPYSNLSRQRSSIDRASEANAFLPLYQVPYLYTHRPNYTHHNLPLNLQQHCQKNAPTPCQMQQSPNPNSILTLLSSYPLLSARTSPQPHPPKQQYHHGKKPHPHPPPHARLLRHPQHAPHRAAQPIPRVLKLVVHLLRQRRRVANLVANEVCQLLPTHHISKHILSS